MTAPLIIEVEVFGVPVGVEVQSQSVIVSSGPPVAVLVAVPGPQGPQGLPGTGVPISGQALTGVQNNINLVFTTAGAYQPNTTAVFINGLRERRGVDYLETNPTTITFTSAPTSTDTIMIDYIVA